MEVEIFLDEDAKMYVSKIMSLRSYYEIVGNLENFTDKSKWIEDIETAFYNVDGWLREPRNVKCYALCDKETNNVKCIILLSKCDDDPYNPHTTPYILDFIYTFRQYRRQKNALKMLLYIKSKEQITAFCSNIESENLFKKAKYIKTGMYEPIVKLLPVYRYP